MKSTTDDDKLFARCPVEFRVIAEHLRTLKYEDRPNYKLIYDQVSRTSSASERVAAQFAKGIRRVGTSFFEPWDWENEKNYLEAEQTAISISDRSSKEKKPISRRSLALH